MKLKEVVSYSINKKNNQVSFHLQSRKLKKKNITPEDLLDMVFIKPKVKFGLKEERKKD